MINMYECPGCGRELTDDRERCPTCGFRDKHGGKTKSFKPTLAALFMVISSVMAFTLALTLFLGDTTMMAERASSMMNNDLYGSIFELLLNICTIVILLIGVLELIGAYFAYRRRNKFVVIMTAFVGIFSIGLMFTSSVFSILALILINVSEDDFV